MTEAAREKIIKLCAERDETIIRISGLSDYVLLEQVREEYLTLEQKIIDEEKLYFSSILRETFEEFKEYYNGQFIKENNILTAIEKSNDLTPGSLAELCDKHRLRKPKTLNDRRLLLLLANEANLKIRLFDIEGKVIDEIGSDRELILYVSVFSRIGEEINSKTTILIQKD